MSLDLIETGTVVDPLVEVSSKIVVSWIVSPGSMDVIFWDTGVTFVCPGIVVRVVDTFVDVSFSISLKVEAAIVASLVVGLLRFAGSGLVLVLFPRIVKWLVVVISMFAWVAKLLSLVVVSLVALSETIVVTVVDVSIWLEIIGSVWL